MPFGWCCAVCGPAGQRLHFVPILAGQHPLGQLWQKGWGEVVPAAGPFFGAPLFVRRHPRPPVPLPLPADGGRKSAGSRRPLIWAGDLCRLGPGPRGQHAGARGLKPWMRCSITMSLLEMLTKWVQYARLETRTKETCAVASVWVEKTRARNESEGRCRPSEVGRLGACTRLAPSTTLDNSDF